jgi:alkylation response protein AidB-like acyl-CoA dehydrogenase
MRTVDRTEEIRTAEDIAAGVARLAPIISARAAGIEAARRIPDDLWTELKDVGCLRMLLPRSHGGLEVALPDALPILAALSRADASVAWTVANCAGAWFDLAGLPRATFDAVFAAPGVTVAGVFAPCGVAERVNGGYRVSGRWGFASGCQHADWLFGNCLEDHEGTRRMRTVVFSASEITIEDTWTVSGLCGTGSHHFTADEVVVPSARTCATLEAEPCVDVPLVRIPAPPLYAFAISATALGVAQAALDDILAMAGGKMPLLAGAPLAANPLFQYQLANADTDLRAARGLAYADASSAWAAAVDRTPFTLEHRARIRATAAWATARATAVVDFAYHAGGGSSLYAANTLQRRLRDIHALTQHFIIKPDTMTTVGAVLAGQDVDLPVF